jgi:DNA-binding CsgD family transcriptional regulator/PAS domain-containing protein
MTNDVNRRDVLLALIDRLYEAPVSSAGWNRFLDDLCNALDGSAVTFIPMESAVVPSGELVETDEDHLSCVSINGSLGRAPFSQSDVALLRDLMPHLGNALQLHRRLAEAHASATDMRHALDRLAQGVVLVSRTGRVLHLNRAAAATVEARDGITVDAGELRAGRTGDTSALRAAIHRAASARERGSPIEGRLDIGRPSGRRSYEVLVTPVVEKLFDAADDSPAVMVFVADPERFVAPPEDRLRTLFGLTRTEARVALALLESLDPAVVANRLDVRVSTIRSHLRQLFLKTNTTRQSDLVRLLLTLSAPAIE